MATLRAPYESSMQLGQGFNSFAQQTCIYNAVTPGKNARTAYWEEDQSKKINQVVSKSARWVDKLSDVADAVNVSASTTIKTGIIGGPVLASWIDSGKFKTSDLNFFMQVKVINETRMASNCTQFQKLDHVPLSQFTEIYGDSFISGWEEGGEFNALISIKVKDKSKIAMIKDALESELNTPIPPGAILSEYSVVESDTDSSTETTINVDWRGGGQFKHPDSRWDINSLKIASARFPELVAKTPQRIYAILTKYTSLKSFHEEMGAFSPLDYGNTGIYAGALLDAYMDYKSISKQIQIMSLELESGTIALVESEPVQDYAGERAASTKSDTREIDIDIPGDDLPTKSWEPEPPRNNDFRPKAMALKPYNASSFGLRKARQDCRFEMKKIVQEVDAVTDDPTIASQPDRTGIYLSPVIFRQLLPVSKVTRKDSDQEL